MADKQKLGYGPAAGFEETEWDAVHGELFADDYSQPDALDGGPIFWQESTGHEPGF